MSQLLIGIVLICIGVGSLVACLPRKGKKAWFVGAPVFESGVPILMIAVFTIGIMLVAAHFTTIDDATLAGAVSKL